MLMEKLVLKPNLLIEVVEGEGISKSEHPINIFNLRAKPLIVVSDKPYFLRQIIQLIIVPDSFVVGRAVSKPKWVQV